jgi:hypothetical protein
MRVRIGPVRICGRAATVSAGPWWRVRHIAGDRPPPVCDVPGNHGEILFGQGLDGVDMPAATDTLGYNNSTPPGVDTLRTAQRTMLCGHVELPGSAGSISGAEGVRYLQRFLDEHGVFGLPGCRGQYCLAYLTLTGDALYLYRSLTMIRPLYYHRWRDGLVFSTDPEDLCDPNRLLRGQVDAAALAVLAVETALPNGASWYDGVNTLPAGYLLTLTDGRVQVTQHDDVRVGEPTRMGFREAARTFRTLCAAAVDRAVADTSSCGIQFSGGLDSAVVAFEASRHPHAAVVPYHFHYALPALTDERRMAERVASHLGLHLEVIDDTASLAPGGAYLIGALPTRAPIAHGLFTPQLALSDALAHLPAPRRLLTGVGGDELLLSDDGTPLRTFGLQGLNPLAAGRAPWQLLDDDVASQMLGYSIRELIDGPTPSAGLWGRFAATVRVLRGTAPLATSPLDPVLGDRASWVTPDVFAQARKLGEVAWREHAEGFARARAGVKRTWLEMYLTYVRFHQIVNDYHAAAWQHAIYDPRGIHYIAPLLDPDLVEFCLTLTTRYRELVHRGHKVPKAVMRAAYAESLPREVVGRVARVDYGQVNETFLLNNKTMIGDLLGPDSMLAADGLIQPQAIRQALAQPAWKLRRQANELIHTVAVELWLRGCQRRPHQPITSLESTAKAATRPGHTSPQPENELENQPISSTPCQPPAMAWHLSPHVTPHFLPDEAVLLDERDFRVYRLSQTSAKLLALILQCDTWKELEKAFHRSDDATFIPLPLDKVCAFINSLLQTGLLTADPFDYSTTTVVTR